MSTQCTTTIERLDSLSEQLQMNNERLDKLEEQMTKITEHAKKNEEHAKKIFVENTLGDFIEKNIGKFI